MNVVVMGNCQARPVLDLLKFMADVSIESETIIIHLAKDSDKAKNERVRDRGGMALDIGSMVDAWLGHSVRPYQTPEFVSQHNLFAKECGSAR